MCPIFKGSLVGGTTDYIATGNAQLEVYALCGILPKHGNI